MGQRITAQDVSSALQAYLEGHKSKYQNTWIAIPEFSTPGVRNGRLDMVAIRTTYQVQEIRGFEIKVSRSDFFNDVESGKYTKYLNVCHSLYFVVPSGLVKKTDVPDGCGLLSWNGNAFTSVLRATRNPEPKALHWQLYTAMLMRQHSLHIDDLQAAARSTDRFHTLRNVMKKYEGPFPEGVDKDALIAWASSRAGHYYSVEMRKTRESKLNDKAEKLLDLCIELGLLKDRDMGSEYGFDGLKKKLMSFARFNNHIQDVQSAASFIQQVMNDWREKPEVDIPECIGQK